MIGPHEGKELELMLKGEKHLSMFHDIIPEAGQISEDIIPENKFSSYVQKGILHREEFEIFSSKHQKRIRYVFFSTPSQAWRIQAYISALKERHAGKEHHKHDDIFLGKLLGYSDNDIQDFIAS